MAIDNPNFKIPNNSSQLKRDILNIAANKGVPYSYFLLEEIKKIRDNYKKQKDGK